jgi:hypothetical protein
MVRALVKSVGARLCKTWTWPTRNVRTLCNRPAPVLEDDEGKPVCAGHHAQLAVDEEPDPEPLWKRALDSRKGES